MMDRLEASGIDLDSVAITAAIADPATGKLGPVAGVLEKIVAAARDRTLGIDTVVVAEDQEEREGEEPGTALRKLHLRPAMEHDALPGLEAKAWPWLWRDALSRLWVVQAGTVAEVEERLGRLAHVGKLCACAPLPRDPCFVGRERLFEEISAFTDRAWRDGRGRFVALIGDAGRGKSRFVSELVRRPNARGGADVVFHVVKVSGSTTDPDKVVRCLLEQLVGRFGLSEPEGNSDPERLASVVERLEVSRPLLVIVDGADQVDRTKLKQGTRLVPDYLPTSIAPGVVFLVTGRDDAWLGVQDPREVDRWCFEDLVDDRADVGTFLEAFVPEAPQEVLDTLRQRGAPRPFFFTVRVLCERLERATLDRRQGIAADSNWFEGPAELLQAILDRAFREAEAIGLRKSSVKRALGLLALCKEEGFSPSELDDLGFWSKEVEDSYEIVGQLLAPRGPNASATTTCQFHYPEAKRIAADILTARETGELHRELAASCLRVVEKRSSPARYYAFRYYVDHLVDADAEEELRALFGGSLAFLRRLLNWVHDLEESQKSLFSPISVLWAAKVKFRSVESSLISAMRFLAGRDHRFQDVLRSWSKQRFDSLDHLGRSLEVELAVSGIRPIGEPVRWPGGGCACLVQVKRMQAPSSLGNAAFSLVAIDAARHRVFEVFPRLTKYTSYLRAETILSVTSFDGQLLMEQEFGPVETVGQTMPTSVSLSPEGNLAVGFCGGLVCLVRMSRSRKGWRGDHLYLNPWSSRARIDSIGWTPDRDRIVIGFNDGIPRYALVRIGDGKILASIEFDREKDWMGQEEVDEIRAKAASCTADPNVFVVDLAGKAVVWHVQRGRLGQLVGEFSMEHSYSIGDVRVVGSEIDNVTVGPSWFLAALIAYTKSTDQFACFASASLAAVAFTGEWSQRWLAPSGEASNQRGRGLLDAFPRFGELISTACEFTGGEFEIAALWQRGEERLLTRYRLLPGDPLS